MALKVRNTLLVSYHRQHLFDLYRSQFLLRNYL